MKTSLRQAATPQHPSQPRRNNRPLPKTPSSGHHPRRRFLGMAAGAAALSAVPRVARAQTYPTRPITIVVPAPAGGPSDAIARVLAEQIRVSLGQSIIIENVGGADGSIATGRVARARPDGYTIELGIKSTHALNGALYSLPYDVLSDFAPIAPLATNPLFLFTRKTMPADNLNELIVWLKANPKTASAGIAATTAHLITAFFEKETKTQFAFVPYRGEAPAIQDLVAGQIDICVGSPLQLPLVRAGSIKAYAATSDTRSTLAPDIPTFTELGLPSLSFSNWYALFAPKQTPKEIIDRLNAATVQALAASVVQSRLLDLGDEIFPRDRQTPEALGSLVKADAGKWWPIIKQLGISGSTPTVPVPPT